MFSHDSKQHLDDNSYTEGIDHNSRGNTSITKIRNYTFHFNFVLADYSATLPVRQSLRAGRAFPIVLIGHFVYKDSSLSFHDRNEFIELHILTLYKFYQTLYFISLITNVLLVIRILVK